MVGPRGFIFLEIIIVSYPLQMKSWLINIVLGASFCFIVFVYYQKDKRSENYIDYLKESLSALDMVLPPEARLNYKGIHSDPVNQWETYLFPRYILTPRVLGTQLPTDTSLVILRLDADTPGVFIDTTATILWEHRDTTYHYYLIKE